MANKKSMTKQEIMDAIETLAHSQGFYDYLYRFFKEHPEALERFEKNKFKDAVDMIRHIEG